MRRYNPDANPSAAADARSGAITAAYAVLSDLGRRAEYDRMLARDAEPKTVPPARRKFSPERVIGAAAIGVPLVLLLLLARSPLAEREPQPDRVADPQPREAMAPKMIPAMGCATPATRDRLKLELFQRAARLRGADQAAFERLAGYSLVRIGESVTTDRQKGSIGCKASVALDLPPGVAVLGGRRTLAAEITYTVDEGAGGKPGGIALFNEGM